MQNDVAVAFSGDGLPINADVGRMGIHPDPQLSDGATVHGHASGQDQLLAGTSRTQAGLGQHFLQTFFEHHSLTLRSRPTPNG